MKKLKSVICLLMLFGLVCTSMGQIADIDGLVLYLEADSIDYSGGSAISLWQDISGENNDASQVDGSYSPILVLNNAVFNSHAAVEFDGINDWLLLPEDIVTVNSFTIFAVANFDHINSNQYLCAGQDGAGDDRLRIQLDTAASLGSPKFLWRAGSSAWTGIITDADTDVHVFTETSAVEGFLDGVSIAATSNGSSENPTAFNLGSYNRGEKDFYSGKLAEFIVYNRELTSSEIKAVNDYLLEKYTPVNNGYSIAVYPIDLQTNISPDVTLTWELSDSPTSHVYDVYIGTTAFSLVQVADDIAVTEFDALNIGGLPSGTDIYWQIRIDNENLSDIYYFKTWSDTVSITDTDFNVDGLVDSMDLFELALSWLENSVRLCDVNADGQVDCGDFCLLAKQWNSSGVMPSRYVISRRMPDVFPVFDGTVPADILIDQNDAKVCLIAADCLANDIELVCGIKPNVCNNMTEVHNLPVIVGTVGGSTFIDALAANGKIEISELSGKWESFIIQVVDNPFSGIGRALVIAGSDRRGTAYGVFDLSENMGVSPWYWWADVPVMHRDIIAVRSGAFQFGPPSVKYRGIFINDEDWGLHPWSRDNYSPEDGYIGPNTYAAVFELLLRLKANYIWPAMHDCTKAFNAFEANKYLADDYAIVMGSSHCEQMLRNNVWEWYRWAPSDGSSLGSWDWCTNGSQIDEYWRDRVRINGQFENVYTLGMRGIHDSGMPCSGETNYQKMLTMQDEIFPAQRQMIADYVDSNVTNVAQMFCPYKEVLDLYRLGMNVPDDVTMVWPDDNHGYIRNLSTTSEQQRNGKAGIYYHISYWGKPHDYLWLCSTPPALVFEEMSKAYAYGADRLWVLNVGDIKPAEINIDMFMRLGWDINSVNFIDDSSFLDQLAWRSFGPEYKSEIADILYEYYQLGQARKPEHMLQNGIGFSYINAGDEAGKRVEQYEQLNTRATAIYESLPDISKDAFYELVLYPVRCAGLMNIKCIEAQRSDIYAAQGRVSANEYAQKASMAYQQIIEETQYYNQEVAGGKWNGIMSYRPRGLAVFNMPSTSTVTPVSGASMGVILEGGLSDVSVLDNNIYGQEFEDDFSDSTFDPWEMTNSDNWQIVSNGINKELGIISSDYSALSGDRLGEMALLGGYVYDEFDFTCLVRSSDNLSSNSSADIAVVFGYEDQSNYYYMIFSNNGSNTGLYRVSDGGRTEVQKVYIAVPDNDYHQMNVHYENGVLTLSYNNTQVIYMTADIPNGMVGVGSYNDMVAFTNVVITALSGVSPDVPVMPVFDPYTDSSYFVDIYNKGDTSFAYQCSVSSDCIVIDAPVGAIETEKRIWLSIDWSKAGVGNTSETVTIAGAGKTVAFDVNIFNPVSPTPADLTGQAVQINGYISIEAENYSRKVAGVEAQWEKMSTLGRTGDSMLVLPVAAESIDNTAAIISGSPCLEYDLYMWDTGMENVVVYCLPTHAINSERGLRYAVAIDDAEPQIVGYDTSEFTSQWNINVIDGIALSSSSHNVASSGHHVLKVWMVDPGVVIDKIVIGDSPVSQCGPAETIVK